MDAKTTMSVTGADKKILPGAVKRISLRDDIIEKAKEIYAEEMQQ